MDVGEEMKAVLFCTLANDIRANTRGFPLASIFLVLSFFGRKKSIKLGDLALQPQGQKLARMASLL